MGRRKDAPQKKYATQPLRTARNKWRHFVKYGSKGTPPRVPNPG